MKLFFCGKAEEGFGWGTCKTHLIRELSKLCEVEVLDKPPTAKLPGPAFVPIADYKLNPLMPVQSEFTMGYCFTECPLDDDSRRNASQYDLIFAGSAWNKQRLVDAGIKTPCEVLLQGIDRDVFKPIPPSERKGFVVFSGGKFEFRKGQDYVITALKQFMAVRKDVTLITAWQNLWPTSIQTMRWSWLINEQEWNSPYGLPKERVFPVSLMRHKLCAEIYGHSHIGLFPNRCEAGNNLVMSEYMACGRPVIASFAHGHKDVLTTKRLTWLGHEWGTVATKQLREHLLLSNGDYDPAGWFNPHVSDIICALEWAYANRTYLPAIGQVCEGLVKELTWEKCARQILAAAKERTPATV